MKIGMITFHRAFNIGANLQAFALNKYINQNNILIISIKKPNITYLAENEKSNRTFCGWMLKKLIVKK